MSILLVISSIFSIIKIKPFTNAATNFNNIYSQAIQMLMMYVGLFYMTGRGLPYMAADSPMHWILMPVNILPSIYFFGAWGQRMAIIGLCVVHEHNIGLFKTLLPILTCGRSTPDSFYRAHIAKKGEFEKDFTHPDVDQDAVHLDSSRGEDGDEAHLEHLQEESGSDRNVVRKKMTGTESAQDTIGASEIELIFSRAVEDSDALEAKVIDDVKAEIRGEYREKYQRKKAAVMQEHNRVLEEEELRVAAAVAELNQEINRVQLLGELGISDSRLLRSGVLPPFLNSKLNA